MTLISDLPLATSVSANDKLILQQQGITKQVTVGAVLTGADVITSASAYLAFAQASFVTVQASTSSITASSVAATLQLYGDSTNIATSVSGSKLFVKYVGAAGQLAFTAVSGSNAKTSASAGNQTIDLRGDGSFISTSVSGGAVKFELINVSSLAGPAFASVAASNANVSASTSRDGFSILGDSTYISTSASASLIFVKFTAVSVFARQAFSSVAASNAVVSASGVRQGLTLIGDNANISTSASGSTIKIKYVAAAGAVALTGVSASNTLVSASTGNTTLDLRGDGTYIGTSASGNSIKIELVNLSAWATQAFASVAADAGNVSASSTRQGLTLKGDTTYITTSASGSSIKFEFIAVSNFAGQAFSSVAADAGGVSASSTRQGLTLKGDTTYITTSASGSSVKFEFVAISVFARAAFSSVAASNATVSASTTRDGLTIRGDGVFVGTSASAAVIVVKQFRPVTIAVSTAREVSAGDENGYIRSNGTSAFTIFIPACASVALPIGYQTMIRQSGTGQITITGRSGVSVQVPASCSAQSRAQGSTLSIIKVAQDTWDLAGDLSTF